ncbi:MAG: hypothetical protein GXO15_00775 [Crenarchaeota archaeon]|nr:hypothetical protein [Thermoproteota archaeon]
MRGVSPLVSAAILLAASIAIGYVIYNYASASAAAVAQKPQLLITASADYVGSTAYIELSIKNAGGAAANITRVTIDGTDVSSQLGLPRQLPPGQEIRKVITIDNLPPGQHIVIVTLSDGSQYKASFVS